MAPLYSYDSKIGFISRGKQWNKLILGEFIQIQKAKSYFRKFWVIVVKSGWELLGCVTLESAISQDWKADMSWFFACCCKFRKAKFLDSRNFKVYARKKKNNIHNFALSFFQSVLINDLENAFFSDICVNYVEVNFLCIKGCTSSSSCLSRKVVGIICHMSSS